MSRQQLSLFCSAPRDRAVIQVISVKTFKTAAILFIASITVSTTSMTLLLTIVDFPCYSYSIVRVPGVKKTKQFINFVFVSDEFMCYMCNRTSSHPHNILEHTMKNHAGPDNFNIRLKVLDEVTGRHAYRSLHFHIQITELIKIIDDAMLNKIPRDRSFNLNLTQKMFGKKL